MYLDKLEKCNTSAEGLTIERLQVTLKDLPTTLFATYDRIIRRIEDSNKRAELLSALRFVLYAAGPVFIEDLIEICAVLPTSSNKALFNEGLRLQQRIL